MRHSDTLYVRLRLSAHRGVYIARIVGGEIVGLVNLITRRKIPVHTKTHRRAEKKIRR